MKRATEMDDELRERFADAEAGEQLVRQSRQALSEARRVAEQTSDDVDVTNVGRAIQRLSEHCRLAGQLEESLELKDEVIELWDEFGKRRAGFLVRLQRALVLAELGRLAEARERLAELREKLTDDPGLEPFYVAFLDEYDARCALWEGDEKRALELLERALAFRNEHRARRIVEWTRTAIGLVRRRYRHDEEESPV